LPNLLSPVRGSWGASVVNGGRLATVVERTVDASEANVNSAVSMVREMANECRWRAVVCDRYAQALQAWEASMGAYNTAVVQHGVAVQAAMAAAKPGEAVVLPNPPGSPPSRPWPPYPWVDA
jgi:hypothetical protein